MSSVMRPPEGGFFTWGKNMNIYIYSDESGVFDKVHNDVFVFGGLIILSKKSRDIWSRKYSAAEKVIREKRNLTNKVEIKATTISNGDKGKLFRSLNQCFKFGVVINQHKILDSIFANKKAKQRYLDYAYKIAVKRAFETLIREGILEPSKVERLFFYVDEHVTATDGNYELKESLEQEFKIGTFNLNYSKFFPPIFPDLMEVQVEFCNSKNKILVRAADIVANKIYFYAKKDDREGLSNIPNLNTIYLP